MKELLLTRGPEYRRWILLALTAGIPIVLWRSYNSPFDVPKYAFIVVGVTLVASIRIMELLEGADRGSLRVLLPPALALTVPLALAWVTTDHKAWSLVGDYGRWGGVVPYAVMALFGVLLADAFIGRPERIAWAVSIAGAVVGGYALIQVMKLDPLTWVLDGEETSRALSTTGNPNFTGGYLGIALPVALGVAVWDVRRRNWAIVSSLLILGGLVASKSYGGWAAGAAGVSVAGGYWLAARWRITRLLGVLGAALVAVVVAGVVLYTIRNPTTEVVPTSIKQRAYAWDAALGMFADRPITGSGPNTYAFKGIEYRPLVDAVRFGFEFPDDPHSVPLAMLANAGILGFLGFVGVIGWAGWLVWRQDLALLEAAFLGAVVAYFIQALVSIDEVTLRSGLWAALAGLAVAGFERPKPLPRSRTTGRKSSARARKGQPLRAWPAVIPLVALIGYSGWWSRGLLNADNLALAGRGAFKAGEPETADVIFDDALEFREETQYRRYEIPGLSQYAFKRMQNQDPEGALELVDAARVSLRGLVIPDLTSIAGYARILYGLGSLDPDLYEEALGQFERLGRIDEMNPNIRLGAADILVSLKRYEDAVETLEPYLEMVEREGLGDDKAMAPVYGALALALAHVGDEAGAREAISRATELQPEERRAVLAQQVLDEGERDRDTGG